MTKLEECRSRLLCVKLPRPSNNDTLNTLTRIKVTTQYILDKYRRDLVSHLNDSNVVNSDSVGVDKLLYNDVKHYIELGLNKMILLKHFYSVCSPRFFDMLELNNEEQMLFYARCIDLYGYIDTVINKLNQLENWDKIIELAGLYHVYRNNSSNLHNLSQEMFEVAINSVSTFNDVEVEIECLQSILEDVEYRKKHDNETINEDQIAYIKSKLVLYKFIG